MSLVNLMSYLSVPIVWCRDNLGFGGVPLLVRTQFGVGTWHAHPDARYARTDLCASFNRIDSVP